MLVTDLSGETAHLVELARRVRATGYAFVTPTPATHARVNARTGSDRAQSLEDVFGWSRPFAEDLLPPAIFAAMRAARVLAPCGDLWRSLVRFSSLGGHLFAHSAYPTLEPDSVFFGPDTYRFAQAIERVLDRSVHRAVDIGCGAGPGAILMARSHRDAEVWAVDINPAALRLTGVNATLASVRVNTVRSDLLADCPGPFDLIVANPPYLVDVGERAYRHGGGPLGADLSLRILDAAIEHLAPGGTLMLYTGAAIIDGIDPFKEAALARLDGTRLCSAYREVDPDVFGEELDAGVYGQADRIAAVTLTVIKPHA